MLKRDIYTYISYNSVCTYLKHIERKTAYSPKYMYTKNTHTYFLIMFSIHLPEAYRKEGGVFTVH